MERNGAERYCANRLTGGEWTVSDDHGVVVVQPVGEPDPPRFTKLSTAQGTLIAVDRGEWGGALLWTPEGQSDPVEVLSENVLSVVPDREGVLAIGGLAHGTGDRGFIQPVQYDQAASQWVLRDRLDLGSAPRAVVPTEQGLVIVTDKAVWRYRQHDLRALKSVNFDFLYPSSVVVADDGSIYVGMRSAVVRLRPAGNTWREEWLRPPSCKHLAGEGPQCRCEDGIGATGGESRPASTL